ncbi:MAG: transcriptional activator NhaR [Acidobacteriia bacterium]|nr:transcriptional activator NhaR [Terriglobia bacterium]
MEWLNYHHLLYFWMVAREGSITQASKQLLLAQPTITGQIRALENTLGQKLFTRSGRNLVLTEVGHLVYHYANEIFSLGRELTGVLKGRPAGRPVRLVVGVSDAMPKLIAYRLLQPALTLPEPAHIICHEDHPERLLAELATFGLDLVLTDAPIGTLVRVRAFSHLLGSCGVSLFATSPLAAKYRKNFPASLDGAPFLLPVERATLRRSLEQWFESLRIHPRVVGEFQDSALLKTFGQAGLGVFAAPTVTEKEVRRQYGVSVLGRTESVIERFYAISVERKLKHPAVVAIAEAARDHLFHPTP